MHGQFTKCKEVTTLYFIIDSMQDYTLSKNLLYTAITRAKDRLFLLGNKKGFLKAKSTPAPTQI